MRLGQLARKIEVKPSDIVGYLATKNIQIEENANTKLESAYVTEVLSHFAPHLTTAQIPDNEVPIVEPADTMAHETVVTSEEVTTPSVQPNVIEDKPVEADVIKAPKIELSGLKVLGKIELPEPKKKQPDVAVESNQPSPTQELRNSKKDKRPSFENRKPRPQKNSIALKREQEAMDAKKKREEELRLQKERRTQNYLKKVKAPQPTKAARLFRENTMEMSQQELAEKPKTWWGKLLRWLTT